MSSGDARNRKRHDRVDSVIFYMVLVGLAVVPLFVFFFSFGNSGLYGIGLHVEHTIAYATAPAADISMVTLVLAESYLSTREYSRRELWALTAAAVVCGLMALNLNCGQAIHDHHWRLAEFDAFGPLLLIGWAELAPRIARKMFDARTAGARKAGERKASDRTQDDAQGGGAGERKKRKASEDTKPPRDRKVIDDGSIPTKREDRVAIVAAMRAKAGGDGAPIDLKLSIIQARFGGISETNASRLQKDARELGAPPAERPADASEGADESIDEPEAAEVI